MQEQVCRCCSVSCSLWRNKARRSELGSESVFVCEMAEMIKLRRSVLRLFLFIKIFLLMKPERDQYHAWHTLSVHFIRNTSSLMSRLLSENHNFITWSFQISFHLRHLRTHLLRLFHPCVCLSASTPVCVTATHLSVFKLILDELIKRAIKHSSSSAPLFLLYFLLFPSSSR